MNAAERHPFICLCRFLCYRQMAHSVSRLVSLFYTRSPSASGLVKFWFAVTNTSKTVDKNMFYLDCLAAELIFRRKYKL